MKVKKERMINMFLVLWMMVICCRFLSVNYPNINFEWSIIEFFYDITILIFSIKFLKKDNKTNSFYKKFFLILCLHWIMFSFIFINESIIEYTRKFSLRYGLFLITIFGTSLFLVKTKKIKEFLKITYFTLAIILIISFCLNLNTFDLSSISNFFSKDLRVRNAFGFIHYNQLGSLCTCELIMYNIISLLEKKSKKRVYNIVNLIIFIMLLASASRAAISALILYHLLLFIMKIKEKVSIRVKVMIIYTIIAIFSLCSFYIVETNMMTDVLNEANRILLFTAALPVYISSGRILQGLGMAANEVYGSGLTPYTTYFLDNGIIYYLVTTGVIGCTMILIALYNLFKGIKNSNMINTKYRFYSMFIVFIYLSLFEASLIYGNIPNYIYISLMLSCSIPEFENDINKNNIKGEEENGKKSRNINLSQIS